MPLTPPPVASSTPIRELESLMAELRLDSPAEPMDLDTPVESA